MNEHGHQGHVVDAQLWKLLSREAVGRYVDMKLFRAILTSALSRSPSTAKHLMENRGWLVDMAERATVEQALECYQAKRAGA